MGCLVLVIIILVVVLIFSSFPDPGCGHSHFYDFIAFLVGDVSEITSGFVYQ